MSKSLGNWVGVRDLLDSESRLWEGGMPGEDEGGRGAWRSARSALVEMARRRGGGGDLVSDSPSSSSNVRLTASPDEASQNEHGRDKQGMDRRPGLFGALAADAFRCLVMSVPYDKPMLLSGRSMEGAASRMRGWDKQLGVFRKCAALAWTVSQAPPLLGEHWDTVGKGVTSEEHGGAWPVHRASQWLRPASPGVTSDADGASGVEGRRAQDGNHEG